MTADNDNAARRIMDELGEENRIPVVNITEGDLYVLLGFPIGGLFVAGLVGSNTLILPFVLLGVLCGAAAVYASPTHLSATTWLADVSRYYCKRPRFTYSAESDAETETQTEGGLVDYTPFTPDERTQDLTNIERAWPGAGAIQRSDQTMEAFLEVDPGNMDFAMSGDWAKIQTAASEFANKELDYSLKFHATTSSFPVEDLITQIETRLSDEDVTDNPVFEELLTEYREQRPKELDGIQQIRYFIGVQVTPLDVYNRYRNERSPAEKLTTIPVIGFLFNPFVTRRENLNETELRAQMFEKLDQRCQAVQSEFIQNATGWSARRLSTVELFLLTMEFWNGTEHEYDDASNAIRDQPILSRERRDDDE